MSEGVWIVDAFTPVAFRGNAAAVCLLDAFPDDAKLQLTAAQMNLSETAFVVPGGALRYKLRWFTPDVEVKLCGHATLAAAHVLHQCGQVQVGQTITFDTLSGELTAKILDKAIELDFPALPGKECKAPAALKSLGVDILACQRNEENYLVEVKDFDTLVACTPVFKTLARLDASGVIITTAKNVPVGFDFASRYFAPAIGINEDPATGSTHCFLAPYWAPKLNKTSFRALQASKGQGILNATISGQRILLSGQAVTTLKGTLLKGTLANPNSNKKPKENTAC